MLWAASVGVHGPTDKTDVVPSPDELLAVLASVGVADAVGHSLPGQPCLQCALLASLASVGDTDGIPVGLTALKTARLPALLALMTASVGGDRPVAESGARDESCQATLVPGSYRDVTLVVLTRKMSPWSEGTAKGRSQEDPLAGGQEGPGHVYLLDRGDAEGVPHAGGCRGQAEGTPGRGGCLLYTSPSPRDVEESRMPSSA